MKRVVFLVLLSFGAIAAHAADGEPACGEKVLLGLADAAHVEGDIAPAPDGIVIAQACKSMPGDPRTMIAVAAFGKELEGDAYGTGTKEQVVALVDAQSGHVLAASHATVEEDAAVHVGPSSYSIDTAPYRLSPEVRAFGVVFTSDARGASCPDAGADSELTLWVRDGHTLRPVLGTNLFGWVTVEGLACPSASGAGRSEGAHMTLAMEKAKTNGFADILLVAHVTSTSRSASGDLRDGPSRTEHTTLKYDDKSYGTDMFRKFWYPQSVK